MVVARPHRPLGLDKQLRETIEKKKREIEVLERRIVAFNAGEVMFQGDTCKEGHDGIRYVKSTCCVTCCGYTAREHQKFMKTLPPVKKTVPDWAIKPATKPVSKQARPRVARPDPTPTHTPTNLWDSMLPGAARPKFKVLGTKVHYSGDDDGQD